jgi:hypothetical protein
MDLALLLRLQGLAQFAADNDLFTVVFVCSDGNVPVQMKGKLRSAGQSIDVCAENSAWSRGPVMGPLHIGDLKTTEAMKYLTEKRHIDPDRASKILEFCGTRILRLGLICDELADGEKLEIPSTF